MKKRKLIILLFSLASMDSLALVDATAVTPMSRYQATNVKRADLPDIWKSMRRDVTSDSICADRAMVWSHEMFQKRNIYSKKAFIHYTNVYNHIVDNAGVHTGFLGSSGWNGWEYHVAPSVVVNGKDIVLDPKFISRPVSVSEWKDVFVRRGVVAINKNAQELIVRLKKNIAKDKKKIEGAWLERTKIKYKARLELDEGALKLLENSRQADGSFKIGCKKIKNIAEHDLDNNNSWCHIQFSNMYHWNQMDLRMLNNGSTDIINSFNYSNESVNKGRAFEQLSFNPEVLEIVYKDAFKGE